MSELNFFMDPPFPLMMETYLSQSGGLQLSLGVAAGLWRGLPSNQVLRRGVICLVLGPRSVGVHLDKQNHGDTRHQLMQSWELALRGGETPRERTLWEGGEEQINAREGRNRRVTLLGSYFGDLTQCLPARTPVMLSTPSPHPRTLTKSTRK